MSIYDEPGIYDTPDEQPPADSEKTAEPADSAADSVIDAEPGDAYQSPGPEAKAPSKKRRGCGGCLLGCGGLLFVLLLIVGGSAWFVARSVPGWTRGMIATMIQETSLPGETKISLMGQVDRLVVGYKSGQISY